MITYATSQNERACWCVCVLVCVCVRGRVGWWNSVQSVAAANETAHFTPTRSHCSLCSAAFKHDLRSHPPPATTPSSPTTLKMCVRGPRLITWKNSKCGRELVPVESTHRHHHTGTRRALILICLPPRKVGDVYLFDFNKTANMRTRDPNNAQSHE